MPGPGMHSGEPVDDALNLSMSEHALPLLNQVKEFIANEVDPITEEYYRLGEARSERWSYGQGQLELLETVKAKAKANGLWNFFLPDAETRAAIPSFFRDKSAMGRLLPVSPVVIMSPYLDFEPMLWQATADFKFKMIEGGVIVPGPQANGPLTALTFRIFQLSQAKPTSTELTAEDRRSFRAEINALHVNAIIVGPSPGRARVEEFCQQLIGEGTESGGVTIYP